MTESESVVADEKETDTATEETDSTVEDAKKIQHAARQAREQYEAVFGLYEDFARSIGVALRDGLSAAEVSVLSVTPRAKSPESFEKKAARPSPESPSKPKYQDPLNEITDKAGVRVITYFVSTLDQVSKVVMSQFDVIEQLNKSTDQPDRVGYQSIHYLVRYPAVRTNFLDFKRFQRLTAEIQVRTILQHAWAEIEHDIQYKAPAALPSRIKRRFAALAGLIEIADREFQAIEDDNRATQAEARKNVEIGQLEHVEITADSIKAFLDRRFGLDRRMSPWSYGWTAKMLLRLGFRTLAEVEECIGRYDDSHISRILYGSRQGQLTRFEDVLLAGMGENFIHAHPWAHEAWFMDRRLAMLDTLRKSGIEVGSYHPPALSTQNGLDPDLSEE